MMDGLIIKGKAIYTTDGAAREYGSIGCNFYKGCPHECEYCYLKRGRLKKQLGGNEALLKKCFKDEADAAAVIRKELDQWLEPCRKFGIFLSFTTDPLIPQTQKLTQIAITEAILRQIPTYILTKNATFITDPEFLEWLNNLRLSARPNIHFGFTLTGRDDLEPKASTNAERIEAMRLLDMKGFSTFASIEPVITWGDSFRIIRDSIDCCGHYKIGLRSGVPHDYYDDIDFAEMVGDLVDYITSANHTVYLKNSVRNRLLELLTPKEYNNIMRDTVEANIY